MRSARAGDHWRNLYQKPFAFKLDKVNYSSLKGFGSGSINFQGGITAICGANGVGKTTLLEALSILLDPNFRKPNLLKLGEANLIGEFTVKGDPRLREVDIGKDQIVAQPSEWDAETVWIDTSFHAPRMVSLFAEMPNVEEMLEAEQPKIATDGDLRLLSYIVGKEYQLCETYELDLAHKGIVPYFRVISDDVEYSSETMGLGEIAAHFILWHLNRVSKNSIVLMEEPETYLAPKSQEALLDVVAKISHEKRIWVILTTHSSGILKSIPTEHIRLLTRIGESVDIILPTGQSDCLQTLGIRTQKSGVIFVEDRAAREYTKCWIGKFSPSLLQEFEVIDVGSKENITNQLRGFPKIGDWFKVFGVYDGDQRGKIQESFNWPYSFLPGDESPEIQLMRLAKTKREELAKATGRDINQINIAISSLEGKDHHDWLIEFPRLISVGYEQLIAYIFDISMNDEIIRNNMEEDFKGLVESLLSSK